MSPRDAVPQPAAIALSDVAGALEGSYLPAGAPGRGAVVAPPHPLYGGSMESPVVGQLGFGCQRAGIASLAYNWRGVGASAGEPSGDPDVAREDYEAALAFVEDSVPGPVVACGYSFGAATALRAGVGRPRVDALVLVAPPAAMLDRDALAAFGGRLWIAAGTGDDLAPIDPLRGLVEGREEAELVELETDHFFMNALSELAKAAGRFLQRLP